MIYGGRRYADAGITLWALCASGKSAPSAAIFYQTVKLAKALLHEIALLLICEARQSCLVRKRGKSPMKTKAWNGTMVIVEFPRADQFAIEAATQFGLRLEDIGHGLVRAYADMKTATAFRAYCA